MASYKIVSTHIRRLEECDESPTIPIVSLKQSRVGPLLAIALQLFVTILIVAITFDGVYLRRPGYLSIHAHFLYITGITITASLITSYTVGQARQLWVLKSAGNQQLQATNRGRHRASTAVGLSSLRDRLKYWPISLSYTVIGLCTAAIVASLSPNSVVGTLAFATYECKLTCQSSIRCSMNYLAALLRMHQHHAFPTPPVLTATICIHGKHPTARI